MLDNVSRKLPHLPRRAIGCRAAARPTTVTKLRYIHIPLRCSNKAGPMVLLLLLNINISKDVISATERTLSGAAG